MRIVLIVPGSGGQFYCENCLRDAALVKALRATGHDVLMVPMYLPLAMDEPDLAAGTPIFFGGINAYLQQHAALFRHTPRWIDRLLDARWLLNLAARRAASTRPRGHGAMTLSMLRGAHGRQAKELTRLLAWLKTAGPIDVVHLSNALLLGLADGIRAEIGAAVVCSLQDEDTWLDALDPPYSARCWQAVAGHGARVSAFTAVSRFYADRVCGRLGVPPDRLFVVHPGVDLEGRAPSPLPLDPPTLGYLARLAPAQGLDALAEAFVRLRRERGHTRLRLRLAGGLTADDRPFLDRLRARWRAAGALLDVEIVPHLDRATRLSFLQGLTTLCVPQPQPEALGLFILDALASGVPVVQPAIGGFPELVNLTGGGVLYDPAMPDALTDALDRLLRAPDRLRELAARGRAAVHARFGLSHAARRMVEVYERAVTAPA